MFYLVHVLLSLVVNLDVHLLKLIISRKFKEWQTTRKFEEWQTVLFR